jgi:hypothetical protein
MDAGEHMNRTLIAGITALTLGFASPLLADQPAPLPLPFKQQVQASQKPGPLLGRTDSLEIPGLTACHQCEWRPKPHEQAAPDQCGAGPDGKPLIGEFQCGFSQECDRVCNFVRCLPQ